MLGILFDERTGLSFKIAASLENRDYGRRDLSR
jgi:hypothetical protein